MTRRYLCLAMLMEKYFGKLIDFKYIRWHISKQLLYESKVSSDEGAENKHSHHPLLCGVEKRWMDGYFTFHPE